MQKLKVLELFAGIGACSKALERLNIPHEIVDAVEIDKYAIQSFNVVHGTNFEPQDITTWDKDIEVDLIMHGSPCITEDSLILTRNGYKQYKDLKIGDYVLTKSNTWQKIAKKFDNGVKMTYFLQGMGFENIHCTDNHKFYTRHMYRKGHKSVRCFEQPEFKEAKNITRKDYFGVPVLKEEKEFYTNNLDFWYMIGYYLGDGWLSCNSYDIILACNDIKLEKLKRHLIQEKWKYTYHNNGTCYRFRFANKNIYDFILKYVGTGSFEKRICGEILSLPKEQLKSLIEGYIDSDGCRNNKYIQFSSVNRELIYGISCIINKIYHRPTSISKNIVPSTKVIEGRTVNQHDWYLLRFKEQDDKQDKAFYEDGYIWYPFTKLIKDKEQCVYNMEIENDHSYIIQGCISKNCQDFSLAGKQAGGDEGSGTRSSLMYETIRIVDKLKPKYVVWENVKNLLSKKHRHNFDAYLKTMENLGYKSYYQVLNAKDYLTPQNRERIFTISIRNDINKDFHFPEKQPLKLRLKDLLDDEVDEKYYLSDVQINRIKTSTFHSNQRRIQEKDWCDTLCARDWKDPKCIQVGNLSGEKWDKIYESCRRVYSENGIAPTIPTCQGGNTEPKIVTNCLYGISDEESFVSKKYNDFINKNGYIPDMYNPYNNCEIYDIAPTQSTCCGSTTSSATILIKNNTKQGYLEAHDGDGCYITNIDKKRGTVQKEMIPTLKTSLDIGVVVNGIYSDESVKRIKNNIIKNDIANTLTANAMQSFNHNNCALIEEDTNVNLRIRKLTPKECWRLMGFDDIDFEKAEKINSNTQLYKQAGNSIVVNVLEEIFKELFKEYIPNLDKWSDLD